MNLNRISALVKQNVCALLSGIFSILMFAIPLQTINQVASTAPGVAAPGFSLRINGFSVMFLESNFRFWGKAYVPYYRTAAIILFAIAAISAVVACLRALMSLFNPDAPFVKNSEKFVIRMGIALAFIYTVCGIVSVVICNPSYNPTTSAYWALILQVFVLILSKLIRRVA